MDTANIKKIARVLDDNSQQGPVKLVNHYLANGWKLLSVGQIENVEYQAVAYVLGAEYEHMPFYEWDSEPLPPMDDGTPVIGVSWFIKPVQQ